MLHSSISGPLIHPLKSYNCKIFCNRKYEGMLRLITGAGSLNKIYQQKVYTLWDIDLRNWFNAENILYNMKFHREIARFHFLDYQSFALFALSTAMYSNNTSQTV